MKESISKDIVKYYGARAPDYEDRDVSLRRNDVDTLRTTCRGMLYGRDVLELACGTGIWTWHLSQFARQVLATDINLSMLEIARRRSYQHSNVRFTLADAYDLTSIGGVFTAGFAGWWLSHVDKSKMERFLEGFHHKLAPGAVVIFIDDTPATMDVTSSTDEHNNKYTIRTLKNGSTHEIIKNTFTEEMLRNLISGVARNINVHTLTYHWLLSYNVGRELPYSKMHS